MQEDTRELRNAFGSFATGVTLMTTFAFDKGPVGMTVNSFSSLSLNPPLLLWSIGLDSTHFDTFNNAEHFAVNILAEEQRDISDAFARSENDQSTYVDSFDVGESGCPIAKSSRAVFECEVFKKITLGDHQVIVGKILGFNVNEGSSPLLFSGGKYRQLGDQL